ncbi:hypothetical protein [Agrobacterium sp. RAC06]|uniref:hypothetical protein n=1 Tax=Agrobacterium sp. RAC06 TaxID=1842536 RepID=UPI00083E66D7|nr:hypothetical protein [Agrobacterium sp. RAC06]
MRIAAAIKNRLKDDLALIASGQPLPARDTGEKPLPLLQPDLEERIKLAAQLAVDAFLMEAAERVRQRAAQELAADSPHTVGKKVAQCVPVTSASPDKTVMQQVVRKRFPLTKRQGPVSSPNKPDAINDTVPAYLQDRRAVLRKRSKLPRFSIIAADYLKLRAMVTPGNMKDVQSASSRISVFLDLIGDHPVDRYEAADLQAFILLMADWPARASLRKRGSAREVIDEARRLGHQPLAEKSVKDGYVAAVRAAMRSGMTSHSYRDPFHDVSVRYPSSLAPSRQTVSLNAKQLTTLFRIGTDSGHLDAAMLPLLAHLTGRRLSALIYLRGIDIVEKFDNVWVVQPTSIVEIEGRARRVPLKTKASLSFFVLHEFFHRIGFIDWALSRSHQFLFPD